MPLPRPSRKIYDEIVEKIKKQKEKLDQIKKIVDAYNPEFWLPLKQMLENRAKGYFNKRNDYCMSLDEMNTKVLWSREDELKHVIGMMDDLIGSYDGLQAEHTQTKKEAKEYAKRLCDAGL